MATFSKKTWVDRVSEQPQRRLLTPTDGGTAMTVDVTRQEGIVIQEGDAFSAANMNNLENRIKTAVDANNNAINSVTQKANTNQQNISNLSGSLTSLTNTVTGIGNRTTALEGELTANGKRIYMDYKNGKYGYNTSANRGADTFHPFKDVPTNGMVIIGPFGIYRSQIYLSYSEDYNRVSFTTYGVIPAPEQNPRPFQFWVGGSNDKSTFTVLYNTDTASATPITLDVSNYKYIQFGSGEGYYNYERIAYFDNVSWE